MVAVASGRSNRAGFADPPSAWSSITRSRAPTTALRLPRMSGFFAESTTISRHGRDSEKPGWTNSPGEGQGSDHPLNPSSSLAWFTSDVPHLPRASLTIAPPFITKATFSRSRTSFRGSPRTAITVDHRHHRALRHGGAERPDVLEMIGPRLEMHVGVDEAGKHRVAAQVHPFRALRDRDSDGADPISLDLQRDVVAESVAGAVEERARPDVEGVGREQKG